MPAQSSAPPPAPICSACAIGEQYGLCRSCAASLPSSEGESSDWSEEEDSGPFLAALNAAAASPPCLPAPTNAGSASDGRELRRHRISNADARAAYIVRTSNLLIGVQDGAHCDQCGAPTRRRCAACLAPGPAPPHTPPPGIGELCTNAGARPLCADCAADGSVLACRPCRSASHPARRPSCLAPARTLAAIRRDRLRGQLAHEAGRRAAADTDGGARPTSGHPAPQHTTPPGIVEPCAESKARSPCAEPAAGCGVEPCHPCGGDDWPSLNSAGAPPVRARAFATRIRPDEQPCSQESTRDSTADGQCRPEGPDEPVPSAPASGFGDSCGAEESRQDGLSGRTPPCAAPPCRTKPPFFNDTFEQRRLRISCHTARRAMIAACLPWAAAGTGPCSPCGVPTSLACVACDARRRLHTRCPDDVARAERLAAFYVHYVCWRCRDDDSVRCCLPCLDVFGDGSDDPFKGGFRTWEELAELNHSATSLAVANAGPCGSCGATTPHTCAACPARRTLLVRTTRSGAGQNPNEAFRAQPLCPRCRDDADLRCCTPCRNAFGCASGDAFPGGFPTWQELVDLNGEAGTAVPISD